MSASNGSAAVAGGPGTVVLLLASSTGGVGQHVRSVARGLVAAGRPVLVCGPAATQDQFDFVLPVPGFGRWRSRRVPRRLTAAVGTLRRLLAAEQADVVHAHGLRAGLVAVLARPVARSWSPGTTRCWPAGYAVPWLVERIVRGARHSVPPPTWWRGSSRWALRDARLARSPLRNRLRRVVAGPPCGPEFAVAADQRR
ncbi:glycosyltransferase [Verrucosispora sp. CWR15]|uniref:Glycosyltransferase n=1 Tax=Verrucosispora sioxanthis TaxID=2499994 RepID=A0A6M1LD65_9ACTN|nr:glycosyltransferase family 4 protein [Verrucosispora sioxanthis]NEE67106.1 glycosyltransferase [Verrucosispora sioxanthis]NGM16216.1 glycosyltransferase [Verrucosispora sioxanthis]